MMTFETSTREELTAIKKGSVSTATLSHSANYFQPFGSMPKRSSSLRPSVLSQLPRLMFSAEAAASNCALRSGDKRTLNIGDRPEPLGTLSLSMIDMYRPIILSSNSLGLYHIMAGLHKETPPNSITSTERGLTTKIVNVSRKL